MDHIHSGFNNSSLFNNSLSDDNYSISSDVDDIFYFEKDDYTNLHQNYELELEKIIKDTNRLSSLVNNRHQLVNEELERLQNIINKNNNFIMEPNMQTINEASFIDNPMLEGYVSPIENKSIINDRDDSQPLESERNWVYWLRWWMHRGRKKMMLMLKKKKRNQFVENPNEVCLNKQFPDSTLIYMDIKDHIHEKQTKFACKHLNKSINKVQVKPYSEISPLFQNQSYKFNDNDANINTGVESVISQPIIYPPSTETTNYKVLTPLVQVSASKSVDLNNDSCFGNIDIETPEFFKQNSLYMLKTHNHHSSTRVVESVKEHLSKRLNVAHESIKAWTIRQPNDVFVDSTDNLETERGRTASRPWNMDMRRSNC